LWLIKTDLSIRRHLITDLIGKLRKLGLLWRKERDRNRFLLSKKISYIDEKDNLRRLLGEKGKENA
jgi:hypothetical protein